MCRWHCRNNTSELFSITPFLSSFFCFLEQKVRGNFLKVLWFNANQAWLTGGRTSPLMSVGELKIMFTFPCLVSKQPLYHMWVLQEPACAQIHKHAHAQAGSLTQLLLHRHTSIRFYYLLFVLHSWVGCSSPFLVPHQRQGACVMHREVTSTPAVCTRLCATQEVVREVWL